MRKIATSLVLLAWLTTAAGADLPPAKGRLLVATGEVQGEIFAKTVILLLHYDESGAMGIVVNRPTDIALDEVVADEDAFARYRGELFWGGPVQMDIILALMQSDDPPPGAESVIDSIYQVPVDKRLGKTSADETSLRLFIGYAGWSAGQLDGEMDRGSWHVVPATAEHVFAEDPRALWKRLAPPPPQYQAASGSTSTL